MKSDYSEKEFEMISQISPQWADMIEKDKTSGTMPPSVLNILGMTCFIYEKTGPAIDSLRRCLKALRECTIYRKTKEYDDLIKL
jgi:hypothetical protein